LMPQNQMALHSTPGCMKAVVPEQTGQVLGSDCSLPAGCVVVETKPNSYGSGFAQAGGGVFATQFDVAGLLWVLFIFVSIISLSFCLLLTFDG